jgi:hypothetical protein
MTAFATTTCAVIAHSSYYLRTGIVDYVQSAALTFE